VAAVGNRYSGSLEGLLRIWGSAVLKFRRGVAEKAGRGWWTRDASARRVTSARCGRRAASVALRTAPSDQLQKPISRPPDVLIRTGNPSVIESETSRIRRESKSQDARRAAGTITRFTVMRSTPGRTSDDHRPPSDRRGPRPLTGHKLTSRRARNPARRHTCLEPDRRQRRARHPAQEPSCSARLPGR
jgi:hypothetical protein